MMTDGGRVRVVTPPRIHQLVTGDTVDRNAVTAVENLSPPAAWTQEVVCALKGVCCSSVDDVSVWFPLPVCEVVVSF